MASASAPAPAVGAPTAKVHVHTVSFSSDELLVSPDSFPGIGDGSLCFLETRSSDGAVAPRVALRATVMGSDPSGGGEKFSKKLQLSVLKSVAESCGVAPWSRGW